MKKKGRGKVLAAGIIVLAIVLIGGGLMYGRTAKNGQQKKAEETENVTGLMVADETEAAGMETVSPLDAKAENQQEDGIDFADLIADDADEGDVSSDSSKSGSSKSSDGSSAAKKDKDSKNQSKGSSKDQNGSHSETMSNGGSKDQNGSHSETGQNSGSKDQQDETSKDQQQETLTDETSWGRIF